MKWVSRKDWGARYGRGPTNITPQHGGVAIHWEGPRMGTFPHSSCDDKVRGIERFHVETRDWAAIAYTLLVCPHGYVFEGRGLGHRTAANGTNDSNQRYYAICALLGKGDPHPTALLDGIADGVDYLRQHGAGPSIKPHSAFFQTDCPGDTLRAAVTSRRFERPSAKPSEEDDVPDYTNLTGDKPIPLPADTWKYATFEDGDGDLWPSVLNGPATVNASLHATVTTEPGRQVQVQFVEVDGDDTVVERYPIAEFLATEGGSYPSETIIGRVQKGHKLRAWVKVVGAAGTLTDRRMQLAHWNG